MNTFVAGKMGEVLAFARVGADTLRRGKKGFAKMLKKSEMQSMSAFFKTLEKQILLLAREGAATKDVEEEASEAKKKITKMRNTYIGKKWNEPDELLEWMGFYTGAALVHWYLIAGAAKELRFTDLSKVSKEAINFYSSLFVSDEKKLHRIGAHATR